MTYGTTTNSVSATRAAEFAEAMRRWPSELQGRVSRGETTEQCDIFMGAKTPEGYGTVGRHLRAHRAAWIWSRRRPIPDGIDVRHLCHNPSCVNPIHLEEGTRLANMADMIRAGRSARGDRNGSVKHPERLARGDSHPARRRPDYLRRGAAHHNAKLTDWQAAELVRRWKAGARLPQLAADYAISLGQARRIAYGKSRKHAGGGPRCSSTANDGSRE